MYIGNINNKVYEMYGNEVIRDLDNKMNEIRRNNIIANIDVVEVKSINTPLNDRIIKDSLSVSKSGRDIMKFYIKLQSSEIVKDINHEAGEQRTISLEYKIQKRYEEQGMDYQNDTEYDYDETKYKFFLQLDDDIKKMASSAIEYYDKNGSFEGMTNEDISKQTKAIEYEDLELLVGLKKEINKIDKSEFEIEGEYYDALVKTIDKSNISEKAKKSIGGYLKHLKLESQKVPEVDKKDEVSSEKIEENKEIRCKEVLKLIKELKN